MTRNVYLGGEFDALTTAKSVDQVPPLVDAFWKAVQASDFPARARLIADEVAAENPDIVAFQELELFRIQSPGDFDPRAPAVNAETVALQGDTLAILQAALAEKGLAYGEPVVVATHTDTELPAFDAQTGLTYDLRMTDRDAIFVRPGLLTEKPRSASFATSIPLRIGDQTTNYLVTMKRGYAAMDVRLGKAAFTFTATHLEVGAAKIFQEAQAAELAKILLAQPGPSVVVGDFNSNAITPTTASYAIMAQSFTEAWPLVAPGDPGPTCCTSIESAEPAPAERIDMVFYRGKVRALAGVRTGLAPAPHTENGTLASDHQGVSVQLEVGH